MKAVEFKKDESLWCENDIRGKVSHPCRVSMLVSTHNLEQLIPITVRSALAQNYADYEVVIADDASTDSSWSKVIETVRQYEGFKGVRVRCLRNSMNLGVVGTFNRLMENSCGEICVWQCGDDVAHLDRVSKIVKCWDMAKIRHPDIVSAVTEANRVGMITDEDYVGDDVLPQYTVYSGCEVFDRKISILGAVAAYSRDQYNFFGPVDPAAKYEDLSMHIRTKLRGSFLIIHEPLLEYRCVGGISTSFHNGSLVATRESVNRVYHTYLQATKDLSRCEGLIPKSRFEMYREYFNWNVLRYDVLHKMMSNSFREKMQSLRMWRCVVRREKVAILWILFILPQPIIDFILLTRAFVGNVCRNVKTCLGRG